MINEIKERTYECLNCKQYSHWMGWIVKLYHSYNNFNSNNDKYALKMFNAIMDMVVHECMGLEKIYEKIKSKSIDLDTILLDEAKTKYDIVLKLLQIVFETDKTDIHQIISMVVNKFMHYYKLYKATSTEHMYLKHSDTYLNLLRWIGTNLYQLLKSGKMSCKCVDLILKIEDIEKQIRDCYPGGYNLSFVDNSIKRSELDDPGIDLSGLLEPDNSNDLRSELFNGILKQNGITQFIDPYIMDTGDKNNRIRLLRILYNCFVMELYRLIHD